MYYMPNLDSNSSNDTLVKILIIYSCAMLLVMINAIAYIIEERISEMQQIVEVDVMEPLIEIEINNLEFENSRHRG